MQQSLGTKRWRKRPRNTKIVSWHIFALAALALASSPWTEQRLVGAISQDESDRTNSNPKPYRSTYGGRIKLVPNRKLVRVVTTTTSAEDGTITPWKKNVGIGEESEKGDREASNVSKPKPTPSSIWTRLSPFVKRGILLAGLTAVAVIDKSPPPTTQALALSTGGAAATTTSSWFPSLRLDWNKLWGLPGEILPSLSAALMIAWIPNLLLQKAYFELAFLFCSLTTQPILRNYLLTEILPSLGGTVRKLFWSEFWKQAWDYLLEPFPHNVLLPTKPKTSSLPQPNSENEVWSKWQADVSKFWSDRVVSRIDKWTASSVKAVLQKNVQASVNGLAEDSFKAVAYAWYPEGLDKKRPVFQLPSNEDTARMIELECEENDKNCIETRTETEETAVESVPNADDTSEKGGADNGENLQASESSPTVELQEVTIEEVVVSN